MHFLYWAIPLWAWLLVGAYQAFQGIRLAIRMRDTLFVIIVQAIILIVLGPVTLIPKASRGRS